MDKHLMELANMEINEILSAVEFRIKQDGMVVAGTTGLGSLVAIARYASQYAEDGPVVVQFKNGKGRWKTYMQMSKGVEDLGDVREF